MKNICIALVGMAVLGCCTLTRAENPGAKVDITGSALFVVPSESDAWKNGFGAEGWLRFWFNENFGLGAVGGFEYWGLKELFGIPKVSDSSPAMYPLPLGGSALLRLPLNRDLSLVFDGGLRVVPIGSNLELRYPGRDSEQVLFDPGVIGVAGANFEGMISRNVFLFAGANYQFDVVEPEAKTDNQKLGEISLEGFVIRAGVGIRF